MTHNRRSLISKVVANDTETKLWIHKHNQTLFRDNKKKKRNVFDKSTVKKERWANALKKKLSRISSASFPISVDQGPGG